MHFASKIIYAYLDHPAVIARLGIPFLLGPGESYPPAGITYSTSKTNTQAVA